MRLRFGIVCGLLWAGFATAGPVDGGEGAASKNATPGSRLLLPLYSVDTNSALGTTTLYAVRNESMDPAQVTIQYFETDAPQAAQRTDVMTLEGKEIVTVNVRDVENLEVGGDGFARGYVIFDTVGGSIHGDYFQADDDENFASGFRLLNIDPASPDNDLCQRFSVRYLESTVPFDSGSIYTIWAEVDAAPTGADPILSYTAYDQAGELLLILDLASDEVAFTASAESLLSAPIPAPPFGAIEFQFNGTVGHISSTLSAKGQFSVGYEATCLD